MIETTHTSVVLVGNNPLTAINLTCVIELSESVDTAVNVTIEWIGPDGIVVLPRSHVASINFSRSLHQFARYSSLISKIRSGHYMCQAGVTSPSEFINGYAVMRSQAHNIVSGI